MNADTDRFPKGLLRTELFLGVVSEVSASQARLNLSVAEHSSGSHFESGRYGRGEVGEFVLIEGQVDLVLARTVNVRVGEPERWEIGRSTKRDHDVSGFVQFLGTVRPDTLGVSAGVANYPRLGDRVYSAPHSFVARIPHLMDKGVGQEPKVELRVGTVSGKSEADVVVRPEKLFGRHCAVLGATGGGKSWTLARLVEESIKHQAKIVLLDATGEYHPLTSADIRHVHLGKPVHKADGSEERGLPPTCFVESDFIALFEPAGKVQGPKLRAAMRSLRLANLKPDLAPEGFIRKIDESKGRVSDAEAESGISSQLDDPRQPFDVTKLVAQMEQECVYPEGFGTQRGVKDPSKWGGESGEFSHCLSLVSRINSVLTSPAFNCVFQADASALTALTEEIDNFVGGTGRLLRVCLSGVAYEFKAREVVANAIGRHLLNGAREGAYRTSPLLVIVDEAHNFLGRQIGGEDSMARLDAFELIAREGRKYGLNLCLGTQRPRDLTEGVLSQIGTLVVHRLTNDRDREVVERACGEIDRSATAFLANLRAGEAVIIGVDFPIPLTVQIARPGSPPSSDGPDYQKAWSLEEDQ